MEAEEPGRHANTALMFFQANTWRLAWTYDRYGNRLSQTLTGGTEAVTEAQLALDSTTNRITGFGYDASGNVLKDPLHGYTFNGENELTGVDTTATYGYDGHRWRVQKTVSGTTTTYVYSGSKVIAEYSGGSLTKEYVYSGNSLLATIAGATVTYHYADQLSNRLETDAGGNVVRTFGHLPFGDVWYETGAADKWKFTGYERDNQSGESGLDYALNRFYSSAYGRFTAPDLFGGNSGNPQSLNRYAYVANDPVNAVDPLGLLTNCTPYHLENCGFPIVGPVIVITIETGTPLIFRPGAGGGGGGSNGNNCAGRTVQISPNARVQSDPNGNIIAIGVQLTGPSQFIASSTGGPIISVPRYTSVGVGLNPDGSVTIAANNPLYVQPGGISGLTGAYLSSVTFNNGSFSQVDGAVAVLGVPVGSTTTPSDYLKNQLNQNSSLINFAGLLQAVGQLIHDVVPCTVVTGR